MKSIKLNGDKRLFRISFLIICSCAVSTATAGILGDSKKLLKLTSHFNWAERPFITVRSRGDPVVLDQPSLVVNTTTLKKIEIAPISSENDEKFNSFLDRPPQCPPIVMPMPILIAKKMNGSCSDTCNGDRDCPDLGHRCCPDGGCGRKCRATMQIQKIPPIPKFIPPNCPGPTSNPSVVCEEGCKSHDECEQGEMCCPNQCAHRVCTRLIY